MSAHQSNAAAQVDETDSRVSQPRARKQKMSIDEAARIAATIAERRTRESFRVQRKGLLILAAAMTQAGAELLAKRERPLHEAGGLLVFGVAGLGEIEVTVRQRPRMGRPARLEHTQKPDHARHPGSELEAYPAAHNR